MKYSAKTLLKKQKAIGKIFLAIFTVGLLMAIAEKDDCTPFVLFMALSAKTAFSNKLLF